MSFSFQRAALIAGGCCVAVAAMASLASADQLAGPTAVAACVLIAWGIGSVATLAGYQYTAWIISAVVAAMLYPAAFLSVGNFDMRNPLLILLVVQTVMFGMGTRMKLADLRGVAIHPKGVLIGVLCQFTIMPIVGFTLTKIFLLPAEIAAGVILIGACSSGLASNVMVFLARANLVLSVTLTAVATILAPLMTPLLMKLLAGTLIEIAFIGMMVQIVKIVLVPIGAALLHDYLRHASPTGKRRALGAASLAAFWLLLALLILPLIGFSPPAVIATSWNLVSCFAAAILVGVAYHYLVIALPLIDKLMPYASMAGIIYFTLVTTAAGRDNLLQVGVVLFMAAVLHNAAGYFLGYWMSRAFGMNKTDARSVSLEVGLQNGGMASGLAGAMGKLGTVGLAAAVFSPWMNISGSILANYWRKHPPIDK